MIDIDLIKKINSGKCIPIIGSGLSSDLGFPSWKELANLSIDFAKKNIPSFNDTKAKNYFNSSLYSNVFSEILKYDKQNIFLNWLKNQFDKEIELKENSSYDIITDWPFNLYITTNFDHAIERYTAKKKLIFIEKLNTVQDFVLLRTNSKNLIFKIHGDFSNFDSLVLTNEQYFAYKDSVDKKYWRDKLFSALNMSDVVIIGYSLNDPDFNEQVERANALSSKDNPIFMFATGLSQKQISDLLITKNIKIIPYSNYDGSHENLRKLLKQYSIFIPKKNSENVGQDYDNNDNSRIAANLYLYSQLRLIDKNENAIKNIYSGFIVQILSTSLNESGWENINELIEKLKSEMRLSFSIDPKIFDESIDFLYSRKKIEISTNEQEIRLTQFGRETSEFARLESELTQKSFFKFCDQYISEMNTTISDSDKEQIIKLINKGLIRSFEKRGLELARSAFTDSKINLSDSIDILQVIIEESNKLVSEEQRIIFIDLMISLFSSPSPQFKKYTASLSQGYFVFSALGYDKNIIDARLKYVTKHTWILDSSILLPLLAKECQDHNFALDLINQAKNIGFSFVTTEKLLKEVDGHLFWSINKASNLAPLAFDYALVVEGKAGYKPNLFIEGYIKWSSSSGNPNFGSYMNYCFQNDSKDLDANFLSDFLKTNFNIEVRPIENFQSFSEELLSSRDTNYSKRIIDKRIELGTYRNDQQCIAEAEVQYICENEDAIFLSTSSILNHLANKKRKIAWKPDTLFRFLSLFTKNNYEDEVIFSSMVQDLRFCGFQIVDKDSINKFVQPSIRQTKLALDEEKQNFINSLGNGDFEVYESRYESIPDDEKPLYSMQFLHQMNQRLIKKVEDNKKTIDSLNSSKLSEKDQKILDKVHKTIEEKQRNRKKQQRRKEAQKKKKH